MVGPDSAVPQDAVDAADARDGLRVTDLLRQELLTDFPGEHARVLLLAAQDLLDDCGRGHLLQPITKRHTQQRPTIEHKHNNNESIHTTFKSLPSFINRTRGNPLYALRANLSPALSSTSLSSPFQHLHSPLSTNTLVSPETLYGKGPPTIPTVSGKHRLVQSINHHI